MFTIEHEFDATIVTLVDQDVAILNEDIVIAVFEDCVTLEQYDARTDRTDKVTFSMAQMRDLRAALNLPEGAYRLAPKTSA